MKKLASSKPHRNAERINAIAEVTGCALKSINPVAELPIKVTQTINSGYHLFAPKMKPHERGLQLLKALIALSESCLLTALLFTGEDCGKTESDLCKTILVLNLIYQGVLAVGWGPSELFKEECHSTNINIDTVNMLNV